MRIGVAGAYGATGALVVGRLARTTDHDLLVGGRNADRSAQLAAELGDRASARAVDVMRPDSLAEFCDACDLLVNCAGPSHLVRDRVARVAVERRTDLVDVGGAELVFPELTRSWDDPARAGVTVIVDAGWIPGLSGVLAHAVTARAREAMTVERLDMVYGDASAWSDTATLDIVELVRMRPGLGTMRGGRFVPAAGTRGTLRRVRLPDPFGGGIATLAFASELHRLGETLDRAEVACWAVPLAGPRATAALLFSLAALRGR
ncbi:MAG: saccharopine dehydrogenase NADP-binding domain-containing protein, partial [Thermoleophilaceae bacterium]